MMTRGNLSSGVPGIRSICLNSGVMTVGDDGRFRLIGGFRSLEHLATIDRVYSRFLGADGDLN